MKRRTLRSGYTTGTCAAAATKGALCALLGDPVKNVSVRLPIDTEAVLPLAHGDTANGQATCLVRKDAGDDPDVTHGALIGSRARWITRGPSSRDVSLLGGTGVGVVTRPGLAVSVGKPAINPVPARMVLAAARDVLAHYREGRAVEVTLFVPNGEELARKTFNPRLGIQGGISILGTTGIVKPYSHEAYKDTIRCSLDIARATGCKHVVLSTGSRSEQYAQRIFTDLPESAFVQIGDHVAYALGEASARQLEGVTIALFFGKLVKIAQGRMNTHVGEGLVQLNLLCREAQKQALRETVRAQMKKAHTAREVLGILVRHRQHGFIDHLCRAALWQSRAWTKKRVRLSLVLFSFTGDILWYDGESIKVA